MYKFCIAVLFLLTIKTAACQLPVLQWAKTFEPRNTYTYSVYSNGRSVAVDQQGNVYSAGLFNRTVDFDPGPGVYTMTGGGFEEYGIYISKLDTKGAFVWAKQIPVLVEFGDIEITLDKNGNVYLTSYLGSVADMDPGPGIHTVTPIGAKDAFIIKLNGNGDFVWVKQFGGPGDTVPYGSAVDIDKDGNVIVCGSFNNTVDFDPGTGTFNLISAGNFAAFIVKLTSNGDFVWAKKMGSYTSTYPSISIRGVKCDKEGNICTTGTFSGDCDFDPGPGTFNFVAGGPGDGFVSKLDINGNFVWAKKIGDSQANYVVIPAGIEIDSHNNVYTAGAFIGKQDFDPGSNVYNLTSYGFTMDPYILKLNAQGDFVWVNDIGGEGYDFGGDLAIDDADNIYGMAVYSGKVDFDPGPGTFLIDGLYDETVVTKFDPDGNFIFAAALSSISEGGSYGTSYGRRLVTDQLQNIYITGFFGGTIDFDPGTEVYPVNSGAYQAPFVLKWSRCANATMATLSITACSSYTLNNATFDSTGTYTQVIPNASGCDSIITLNLAINKKFTDQAKTICEGETYYAGGVKQTLAGMYKDTLRNFLGCDSIITTYLTVHPKPIPDLGPDKDLCDGTTLAVTPGTFSTYTWQNMSAKSSFNIDTKGVFWVKVTNSFNCSATDSIFIRAINPKPADFLKPTDSICSYDKLSLQASNSFGNYFWSTGDRSKNIEIEAPGKYWLTVTDTKGCTGADTVTVFPKECISGVFIPTAFTPDGDGKNDLFKALVYRKIVSFKLQVFDRAGQLIFETANPSAGWNGTGKGGTPYATSVFAWQCFYQLDDKQNHYQKGTVTLVR